MGTHWEISLVRQPAIFETMYLGAQMEFEGVLWCKNILFFVLCIGSNVECIEQHYTGEITNVNIFLY